MADILNRGPVTDAVCTSIKQQRQEWETTGLNVTARYVKMRFDTREMNHNHKTMFGERIVVEWWQC